MSGIDSELRARCLATAERGTALAQQLANEMSPDVATACCAMAAATLLCNIDYEKLHMDRDEIVSSFCTLVTNLVRQFDADEPAEVE